MGAPDNIKRLVDTFHRNIDDYKSGSINETQLRREFLDPFFIELGWDVENRSGYADAYKDVIHEYSLKTIDVREAPDYCKIPEKLSPGISIIITASDFKVHYVI